MLTEFEKLQFCKICTKRAFDPNKGTICSLTNAKPTFVQNCPSFQTDLKRLERDNLMSEGGALDYNVDYDSSSHNSYSGSSSGPSTGKIIFSVIKLIVTIVAIVAACAR